LNNLTIYNFNIKIKINGEKMKILTTLALGTVLSVSLLHKKKQQMIYLKQ